jgi:FtsP/CotA-like multicopper oxidase with cupredoxin domain
VSNHLYRLILTAAVSAGIAGCTRPFAPSVERVIPNDNRIAGGALKEGVLTIHLEARLGVWHPDENDSPGLVMQMFSEVGHAPQNPGPLIRVREGTRVVVTLHNTLDSNLVVCGFHTRPSVLFDTLHIAPGATRELSFIAGAPGTYFYWATSTDNPVADRSGIDSQLHGALVIDPADGPVADDRIFVLGDWTGPSDSNRLNASLRVINGLSWPHTERFTFNVGDTVRWRWIDASDSPHPMHLHGFYFDVTHRGTWAADTVVGDGDIRSVVTEMPAPGGTFSMTWVPEEPGRWLFHCHVAFHTSFFLNTAIIPDPEDGVAMDPMKHASDAMRGMVLGITVNPGHSTARRPMTSTGARNIRLFAQSAPGRYRLGPLSMDEMAFVQQEGSVAPAPDSVPTPSSLLVLRRGEPVRITIVNRTRAPTGVHWHGIEVPSYSDGVAGWSGDGATMAPMIAPGDSFVAAFTPSRAGTFMYHAHSNETFQVNLGLYGALLVVDSAAYHPLRERLIIIAGNGPYGGKPARINGKVVPDTLHMIVGETYRIRLVEILPDWTVRLALTREDSVVHWKALAKDGAELRTAAQRVQAARFLTGPGQTMDFEYRPTAPGLMKLEVAQRTGGWKTHLPIRVER